jgi:hypothetical protein
MSDGKIELWVELPRIDRERTADSVRKGTAAVPQYRAAIVPHLV